MKKNCKDCGIDISFRGTTASRCLECGAVAEDKWRKFHAQKPHIRLRKRELRGGWKKGTLENAFKKQEGKCAACKAPFGVMDPKNMRADHDRITGKFRGLLCIRCNLALSNALYSPKILCTLIDYLESS